MAANPPGQGKPVRGSPRRLRCGTAGPAGAGAGKRLISPARGPGQPAGKGSGGGGVGGGWGI